MSIQKAATILNVLQQNLAVMAEAESRGIPPADFVLSMLERQGASIPDMNLIMPLIGPLVTVLKSP